MRFSTTFIAGSLAFGTALCSPIPTSPFLKNIFGLVKPNVEAALGDPALPENARNKLADVLEQVEELMTILSVPPVKRNGLFEANSLKDIFGLVRPQVEHALANPSLPEVAREKIHDVLDQVQDLIPLLPEIPLNKRNGLFGATSLKDIFGLVRPQVENALANPTIPEDARNKLHGVLEQVEGLIPLLPEVPLNKRNGLLGAASLKDIFGLIRPQLEKAIKNPVVPEEARSKLDDVLDQVQEVIPLLPELPLTKRADKLTKPADYDDPNFARVVLDDWVNEIYRQAMVVRFKEANPSMALTQQEYDEVTAEISFLAISVPEEEYCTKVSHEVSNFEFIIKPEILRSMCSKQRNELLAVHEEGERLYLEKEAAVTAGNLQGAKDLAHRLEDLLKKEREHGKHARLERTRWIDKQVQRAKHEEAVRNGEKDDIYRRA